MPHKKISRHCTARAAADGILLAAHRYATCCGDPGAGDDAEGDSGGR